MPCPQGGEGGGGDLVLILVQLKHANNNNKKLALLPTINACAIGNLTENGTKDSFGGVRMKIDILGLNQLRREK